MKTNNYLLYKIMFVLLLFTAFAEQYVQAQSGLYAGGYFRRNRPNSISDLKNSGFTYIILFNVDIDANGNFSMDGDALCTNGSYTFNATNPNYINDVTALKLGVTSINRVETCIGGWGNGSFGNIKNLINSQGTGSNTNLYKNFQALKKAIPAIDAINFDDESTYDVNSATAFAVMLGNIGFKVTLAPYMNDGYWKSLASNANSQRSGTVDRVDLQCYDGGKYNNPCTWNFGSIPVTTGMWNYDSPATVQTSMTNWKNQCGVKGGFMWLYDDFATGLKAYSAVINGVFGITINYPKTEATFYSDCNYGGTAVALPVGNYTLGQLNALGIRNDDLSSVKVTSGYDVILYWDDNYGGSSINITADNSCLVSNGWNDQASSIKIQPVSAAFKITIQAENYSIMSGVQTEATTDAGGGSDVGYIDAGDWMAYYNITFPTTGTYTVQYRVASVSGSKLSMDLNAGSIQLGAVNIPATGGWQNWTTVSQTINVNAGTYNVGLFAQATGWNINWFSITKSSGARVGQFDDAATMDVTSNYDLSTGFEVSPNPVSQELTLMAPFSTAGGNVQIIGGMGTEVYNGALQNASVDVSTLSAGVYTLIYTKDGNKIVKRFVKQ